MPAWVKHSIWWHLYPLGFLGAEPNALQHANVTHRLRRLVNWLDYAIELGASGLLLGPIFGATTHGYDTTDHFLIDPRLGDDGDFDALLICAKERGLRVLLDGVFNHVGRDFAAFREVLDNGRSAPRANWFRLSWPSVHRPGAEPDYATFEGHRQLVALNHAEPAVSEYVVKVMNHWLDRGVDGWRLDAAYAVPMRFWANVLQQVRARHPNAYFVGEVIHGDYNTFARESGVDSVTQYELWKAIWSALNDRNFYELAWALNRHNRFLDDLVPFTFVGNHDVTRLASRLHDQLHIAHALAVLLTCGGTPAIYAGDEQAFRGVKFNRAGGDDAVRPPFPERPSDLGDLGWPIYRLHQELIGLRRQNPWLHASRTKIIHLSKAQLVFETFSEDNHLVVALNLADDAFSQPVPFMEVVLTGDGSLVHNGTQDARVHLPPHGWAIMIPEPANNVGGHANNGERKGT